MSRMRPHLRRRIGVARDHPSYRWWFLSVTSLGLFLATVNSGTLLIALPDVERELGVVAADPGLGDPGVHGREAPPCLLHGRAARATSSAASALYVAGCPCSPSRRWARACRARRHGS